MIKANFHTHIYLCKHAEGIPDDYIELAINLGYHTIGITDHGPLTDEIFSKYITRRMSFDEYKTIYLPLVTSAKKKYKNDIKVLIGLETEYFPQMINHYKKFIKELDYLILGLHLFYIDGVYYNVYHPMNEKTIEYYVSTAIKAMESGMFKIFAHPELFFWSYEKKWDKICDRASRRLIQAAIDNKVLLEVNANGIRNSIRHQKIIKNANGQINYAYPNRDFWKIAKELDAKVIINDDAHWFSDMNDNATAEAEMLAKELQLNVVDQLLK